MKYQRMAILGDWAFYRVTLGDETLYTWAARTDEKQKTGELYSTVEHAMAAAIAEKYTGPRGAGGTGVGTAADWFMKMIGADLPTKEQAIDRVHQNLASSSTAIDPRNPKIAETIVEALDLGLRP